MTLRNILVFPDPRLREVAQEVKVFDEKLKSLSEDLLETMYEFKGIGLAATQIGVPKRIIVIDISEEKDEPQVFINPKIKDIKLSKIDKIKLGFFSRKDVSIIQPLSDSASERFNGIPPVRDRCSARGKQTPDSKQYRHQRRHHHDGGQAVVREPHRDMGHEH